MCKGKAELNIEIKPSTFTPTLGAHGLFVKIGTFPQTTYAGITRIRFKGLCFQQISASRRPCFHVRFQYSRSPPKVKPPAVYRPAGAHILEQAHFGGREQS